MSWALTPEATAQIISEQESAPSTSPQNRARDVAITSIQFLTGCRNQELFGLRWRHVTNRQIEFTDVVSAGVLSAGKVEGSQRTFPINDAIEQTLGVWRAAQEAAGKPTSDESFLFPGTAKEGHWSEWQMKQWGPRRFTPACARAARRSTDLGQIVGATPYSLRRGHISFRLRNGDDLAVVARQCGTSVQMLVRHYWREMTAESTDEALWERFLQTRAAIDESR